MSEERKKKTSLNKEISEFIKAHPQSIYTKGFRLQQVWENIASEKELEHTDNIARATDKKETILIYVDSSHWAAELSTKRELYRILLEQELNESINEVKFLVTRKASLKKIFQKKLKQSAAAKKEERSIALNKEEDRYAREMVSVINNEELRTRLYNAIKTDFEWKKGREGLNLPQNPPESPKTL
jgi:hypothetical protein